MNDVSALSSRLVGRYKFRQVHKVGFKYRSNSKYTRVRILYIIGEIKNFEQRSNLNFLHSHQVKFELSVSYPSEISSSKSENQP